ncbi:MAG: hydantoinase B/oxoprolinase family protein [Rhodospirillales bacterium]|jgi:N-methylhydantoinase B|nr:hydantoinase B/oxoprolinase family protein [Rhodospirillales bacterium]
MDVDPIRLEIIKNSLTMISDNIMTSVVRVSRSSLVRNNLDFSASICDASGRIVAQGLALPAHLGSIMPALRGCLDQFEGDIHPGDILAINDPYLGGSHLNDIFMFKPVFADSECVCILALILHHLDVGGRVAGGNAADSDEIFQEGLCIPPCKIYSRGEPNDMLLRIIERNSRAPGKVLGDVKAQISALMAAERDVHRLLARYTVSELKLYMGELLDYSERVVRSSLAALPDGDAEFTEWNDDDGCGNGPVKIQVKLTKEGDRIKVDYTGTSPQMNGALHLNYSFTASCTYAALRAIMPKNTPNNAGFYRPIEIVAPEGCWLNVRYPAALGARGQGGYRVRSAMLGALSKLLPDRIPACPGGSELGVSIAGRAPDGKPFLHMEFHAMTGHGGGPQVDGQDAGPYCLGNLANAPVELIEAENPILIEEYGFLADTGGPGRYRGGLGIVRQYRLLADEATIQVRADRHLHQCWGLHDGKGGRPGASYWISAGSRRKIPSKFIRTMRKNDVFRTEMAGSGGYGDPFLRDPEAVARDVKQGKISPAHALKEYGVRIDPMTSTVTSTVRVRSEEPKAGRAGAGTVSFSKHNFYQRLAANRSRFLQRVTEEAGKTVGMPSEWRGSLGLTGSNSARPSYLRADVIAAMAEGARSPVGLTTYIERLRTLVKNHYGDHYDAIATNTCEAGIWASLEALASPPIGGRGEGYRARYIGLHEGHIEHHLSYGRPYPPKYKDIFADRTNVAGEYGVLGRRLNNLDVIIVPIAGATYSVHGIKSFVVPQLMDADAVATKAELERTVHRHGDCVSAIVSLGYDTPGYGYGEKADGETSDLKVAMGAIARQNNVPYIVDNARGIPFFGPHPDRYGADLLLFSMDKVAGAATSGLIIGREDSVVALQRILGFHSERYSGDTAYGKGAMVAFDPGREALVSQVAALEWIRDNGDQIRSAIDGLYEIVVNEMQPLMDIYGEGIAIEKTYNGGGVEINYTRTWTADGAVGLPIFSTEDKAANMNLISSGVSALGILPPSADEGNITITLGRGMLDEEGGLLPERARIAVRGLAEVLRILSEVSRP